MMIKVINNKHIDGLVQERRNSSALALELRLSCTNSSTSLVDFQVSYHFDKNNNSPFYFHLIDTYSAYDISTMIQTLDQAMSTGTKPSPHPMLTQICEAIWHHWATMNGSTYVHLEWVITRVHNGHDQQITSWLLKKISKLLVNLNYNDTCFLFFPLNFL